MADESSGAGRGWPFTAYHWALILATPFLQLAINPNLFINPNTNKWIDNWVYTGFFLSLPEHLVRWGDTYYATRLSWLLPGFAVHQLFSPLVANYVLHLGLYYLLLVAVYFLVTAGIGRTTAGVTTLLIAWNPGVLGAISWDYVDGAVITYFAVTLLCLEKASSGYPHRWWQWGAGAGVGLACMASANLVATTLAPVCGLFLLLRMGPARWRIVVGTLLVAAVAAVATLALLGFANHQLGGQWLFLKPSLNYATTRMWLTSPWDSEGTAWLPEAHFLVLPAVASLGALLALSRRSPAVRSFAGTIQLTFLVAAAWWVVHSVLWTHSIHISYYTSYLIPLGLLALVLQPWSPLSGGDPRPPRHVVALELATLVVLMVAHICVFRRGDLGWTAAVATLSTLVPAVERFNAVTAFVICSVGLVSLRLLPAVWFRWPVFLLVLWIAYGSVPPNWATADTPHVREDFALTASAHRFIKQHVDPSQRLRMWYTITTGEPRPFRNISSSYLWGWMLVNEEMPSLTESQAASIVPKTRLVLLVGGQSEIDVARRALQRVGLDYAPQVQQRFGPDDRAFWVVVGDVFQVTPPAP